MELEYSTAGQTPEQAAEAFAAIVEAMRQGSSATWIVLRQPAERAHKAPLK